MPSLNFCFRTNGSGVYLGDELCLIYWVQGKTLNARAARKSLDEIHPATGLSSKPVQAVKKGKNILISLCAFYYHACTMEPLYCGHH